MTFEITYGDMIKVYKIRTGKYDFDFGLCSKLVPQLCKYDFMKYYFTYRFVPVWNSLPIEVVMADNINI